jgi:drug/metabolite transporter (DMT)-like permease
MKTFLPAFLVATAAALGNALFVYAQKRAGRPANPLGLVALITAACLLCLVVAAAFYPVRPLAAYARANAPWIALGGFGLFVTFTGFYVLFSRYGAAYYVVYAVASVLTTSIGVGLLVFRERFNGFHAASVACALAAVACFALGNAR